MTFNAEVKNSRAEHFATLIDNNQSNPRMLYNIVSCVIDPPPGQLLDATSEKYKEFLSFFTQKIANIRSCIPPLDFPIIQVINDLLLQLMRARHPFLFSWI